MPDEINPDGTIKGMENAEPPASSEPVQPQVEQVEAPAVEQVVEPAQQVETTKDDSAPKAETTKEGEEKVIDFNSFLDAAGKPKIETTPKEDATKEKPDETTNVVDKAVVKDGQRDYSGIDEKDVPHFKRMSNDAFAAFKPVYQEHKKLKNEVAEKTTKLTETEKQLNELKTKGPQLPESYYENPNAYLLDPEFQSSVQDLNTTRAILQHWTKQYEAVAEGAKEFDYLDTDPRTGQLVITGKVPANRGSEAKLLSYINHAQNLVNNQQVKLQTSMQTHQFKHTENTKQVNTLRETFFNGLYKTSEDKAIYEPLVKEKFEMIPPAFRNSPIATMLAESLTMNQVLAQLLDKAAKEKGQPAAQAAQIKAKLPASRRNPTAAQINGDGNDNKGNKEEVTFDDFQRVKDGY
jgi:hypothetical protein